MTKFGTICAFLAMGVAYAQTTPTLLVPGPGNPFAAGANPRFVVAGDFNNDQISDVAIVNPYSNTVTVLPGSITGALALLATPVGVSQPQGLPPMLLTTGNLPSSAAVGYFVTGTPNLCIAVTNLGDNNVSIFLGTGTGLPQTANSTPNVGLAPMAIVAADFDGDGNVDLAVANAGGNSVTVLFGKGDGTFAKRSAVPDIPVGARPVSLAVGNFGGLPGLAVVNERDGTVTVLVGDGTGNLKPSLRSPFAVLAGMFTAQYAFPSSVAVADVNGDGYPDIVTTNDGAGNISVLLGDGLGGFTFSAASPIAVGANPMAIVTADFNGDGNPDVAVANFGSGTVTVLLGDGTGAFNPPTGNAPLSVGASPISLAVGDFNGQSRADLVVANEGDNTVNVFLNQLAPPVTVVSSASYLSPVSPGSLVSIMGSNLASAKGVPPAPTLTVNGTSVVIKYSNNTQDVLQLTAVTPNQVNAVIPPNPPYPTGFTPNPSAINPVPGLATVTVFAPGKTQTSQVEIAPYAPALFSANQNGTGVASATFQGNLSPASVNAWQCPGGAATCTCPVSSAVACVPNPLDLGAGGMLTLIATGLNNLPTVTVSLGNESFTNVPVVAQPGLPGVYAVTVTLPSNLPTVPSSNPRLRGLLPVALSVPGAQGTVEVASNVVTVLFE
jgi:uncharacterized protein (TIGR03437 family)